MLKLSRPSTRPHSPGKHQTTFGGVTRAPLFNRECDISTLQPANIILMASAAAGSTSFGGGDTTSQGFIAELIAGRSTTVLIFATIVLASSIVLPLLNKLLTPQIDPKEPPLLKPTIPFIGHIIGIIRHQADYHRIIHDANPSYSIATLPMLNGKMYVVYDPYLVHVLLKNKVASFEPFTTEFAQKIFDLSEEAFNKVLTIPNLISEFNDAIHASFQTDMLHKMNVQFLQEIVLTTGAISDGTYRVNPLNPGEETILDQGVKVENLYMWVRQVMSLATTRSLYGDHDPFNEDPTLIDPMWMFEEAVPSLMMLPFPSITMSEAFQARARLQTVMGNYYSGEHEITHPKTGQITFNRARVLRERGFTAKEIGQMEIFLPIAATTNAVPTLYWLLLYICAKPDLVAKLRDEIEAAITISNDDGHGRTVSLDVADFEEKTPLLVSCYRETMRLKNHSISMRRAMSDMVINGADGQSYLLKKGTDLQLPVGVAHGDASIWGDNVSEFVPDRFVTPSPTTGQDRVSGVTDADRKKKISFIPFGGGRHYCPGRNFAFFEIMSFISILLLSFDIEPVGMAFSDMKMRPPLLSSGTAKPMHRGSGLGAKILRRRGWDGVQWDFKR